MVFIVEDNFTRTNGALGVATNGNTWTTVLYGNATLGIVSNKYNFIVTGTTVQQNNQSSFTVTPNPTRIDINGMNINTNYTANTYPYIMIGNSTPLVSGSQAIYCLVRLGTTNQFSWYNGTWNGIGWAPTLNVDFDVSFRNINYATFTYDIYINNVLKYTGATFFNNVNILKVGFLDTAIAGFNHNNKITSITTGVQTIGYSKKVNGVTVSKVNGIPKSNIGKVNGI